MHDPGMTLGKAAEQLGKDPSGLRAFIVANRTLEADPCQPKACGARKGCSLAGICRQCLRPEGSRCRGCPRGCGPSRPGFGRMPHCERIRKFPYCRVGCPKSPRRRSTLGSGTSTRNRVRYTTVIARGKLAALCLDEKVLAINEYRFIAPNNVNLTPGLIKI